MAPLQAFALLRAQHAENCVIGIDLFCDHIRTSCWKVAMDGHGMIFVYFSQNCVGFLFLDLYLPPPPPSPPPPRPHTPLCHTPSLSHHLCHTICHTIFHIQLCHTPSLSHHLCHTPSVTQRLCHTIFHTHLAHATHGSDWAGSGGALGSPWSPVTPVTAVALLRGRRGMWRHRRSRKNRKRARHFFGGVFCRDGSSHAPWTFDTESFQVVFFFDTCFFLEWPSFRQANLADKDKCRILTEIPVKDWIGCPATASSLSALVGAIVPGQLRKLETVFDVVGLQVLGISSVKTDTDVWLIDSCVKCKKAAPCEAWRPSLRFCDVHSLFQIHMSPETQSCSEIECVRAVRLTPPTAPRNTLPCCSHLQIATASAPSCSTTNWCYEPQPAWIGFYQTPWQTLRHFACSCATCSAMLSGCADSLSAKMTISKLWSWSASTCSHA